MLNRASHSSTHRTWPVFFSVPALVAFGNGWPGAQGQGIDATVHDLTGGGVSEICVSCHTPHAANAEVQVPLWNKPTSRATYQLFDRTTIDGTVLAVGSVSTACLSCHDGTQSTDVAIDASGSRGVEVSGIALRGGNRFLDDASKPDFLGTDLTDDHPIGLQYDGFAVNGSKIDPDLKETGEGVSVPTINCQPGCWVDTGVAGDRSGERDKSDLISIPALTAARSNPLSSAAVATTHIATRARPFFVSRMQEAKNA